jgi:hypothetical protein
MGIKIDLTGQKFNRLTVIREAPKRKNYTSMYWLCECECKKYIIVSAVDLKRGHTKSCGCYRSEMVIKKNISRKTHGQTTKGNISHEYRIWCGIKNRCYNSNHTYYKHYGGRGIKMYFEWINSFDCFYAYVGKSPTKKHTIDRINNDGNYEPGNVRWATMKEQANNRSNTRYFNYNGKLLTISQLSDISNISYTTLKYRLNKEWTLEKAMTEPIKINL